MEKHIRLQGVRTHNLKGFDVAIPRDKLVVITGLSGSGKSSLAFDTIYAEGQRRYVESLSSYARQFLSMMEKPELDHIEGLSPAISIEQKSTSHNPRSTVGTITEIHDYLRLLYARIGTPRCPQHGTSLSAQTISQMVDQIMQIEPGSKLMLLAPVVDQRKGEYEQLFRELQSKGYVRFRVDNTLYEADQLPTLEKNIKHSIEVVVDRFKIRADLPQRLADSIATALALSEGTIIIAWLDGTREDMRFSAVYACPQCGYSINELEPRLFSFNNPAGACPECDGLGVHRYMDADKIVHDPKLSLAQGAIRGWDKRNKYYYQMLTSIADYFDFDIHTPFAKLDKKIREIILYGYQDALIPFVFSNDRGQQTIREIQFEGVVPNMERRFRQTESGKLRDELAKYQASRSCDVCQGERLNEAARNVFVADYSLPRLSRLSIEQIYDICAHLDFSGSKKTIATKILHEINQRLRFLINVGLNYLSLDRSADTLSGGEAQRIRLASQIGAGLVGVMYILDEPSIGLHQRDNRKLLDTLTYLRDLGNTVIVVEHDEDAIRSADYILDIGPGAGKHGGEIVAQGSLKQILRNKDSLTAQYLNGKRYIPLPKQRVSPDKSKWIKIRGASGNNLKQVNVEIPVGLLTLVTGVSGSGKSTLINDTLFQYAAMRLNPNSAIHRSQLPPFKKISGMRHFDKVIDIDQSPIGRTPRSNPATYTGLFTAIRELFAATNEARSRGYAPGRFSFNVKGGRCEACQGDGVVRIEMHFLADIYVPCDVCRGKRYNRETLEILYKGRNIHQVLQMTVEEAAEFYQAIPAIKRRLDTLIDVGLSYLQLGQSATTLSGGEAQRVKLARELSKRDTGKTLYILDEPTTGLHFEDIRQLLQVLHTLRDHGNTIIIIEHNLDVIKTADWIIDIGPEGGKDGGQIIAAGTPEQICAVAASHTGRFLKPYLNQA